MKKYYAVNVAALEKLQFLQVRQKETNGKKYKMQAKDNTEKV